MVGTEIPRRGYHLKKTHRLIVTSATYQQTSRLRPNADEQTTTAWRQALEEDSENERWSRGPRRRLEGETLRDAMLAASGSLSFRRGGPGVMAPLPEELVSSLLKGHWEVDPERSEHDRRSIYLFARRNLRYPLFDVFDRPDANASCARRQSTTTAPQALSLLNSEFSHQAADRLAATILEGLSAPPGARRETSAQIAQLYLRTLGRRPTNDELRRATDFLTAQSDALRAAYPNPSDLALPPELASAEAPYQAAALASLCLATWNFNEFLYVD